MGTLLQDLRYGFRTFLRMPGVTAIAVLTMGLGIGINTAVFSLINVLMFRPFPYPDAERLVQIWENNLPKGWGESSVAAANFYDWRSQSRSFDEMALYYNENFALTGSGEPERVPGMAGTANLLDLIRVKPTLGRGFLPEEDRPGADPVAVISHGLWKRRFAGAEDLLGRKIVLNGTSRTVIGVMPPGFSFLYNPAEVWTPLVLDPGNLDREGHGSLAMGRLKAGISLARARAELNTIARGLEKQYPKTNAGWGVALNTAWEEVFGTNTRTALISIFLSVLFVLLIGCANVANLLLARAASREREISIRRAIGAGRARLVRQMLTESVLLSLCGGMAGIFVAVWGVEILKAIAPSTIPRMDEVGVNGTALLYTLALSVATGILFGLAPALQRSRPNLMGSLQESGRGSSGVSRHRLLKTLVVSEVALAVVLLAAAGLMIRSVQRIYSVDPGFKTENLLTARIALPETRYPERAARSAFYQQALARVRAVPAVRHASLVSTLPLGGWNSWTDLLIEGRPAPAAGEENTVGFLVVGTDYFETFGIPLIRGRGFTEADTLDAPPVAVINETMARRYWRAGEDPIGRRIRRSSAGPEAPWVTIIGIAADVRHQNLEDPPRPEVYWSQAQQAPLELTLVARTSSDPLQMVAAIRQQVWSVDKDLPLFDIRAMDEVIDRRTAGSRSLAKVMGGPAAIALLMAALGLYGVLAFSVGERTNEIGIRMALGARSGDILKLVLRQGLILISTGMVLGLAGALAVTRLLTSLLSGTSATDPATFIAVGMILSTVALLACYLPARRASRVDPMVALRYE
jgi:putative ABC transport system permease protein